MKRETRTVIKNAFANVARGCAAAIVAVVLPPFLTRRMSPDAFGAWSLVLQLSAFIGYLDFGIQTAVGRFFAHASERGDLDHRDRILNTSLLALTIAGAVGIAAAVVLAVLLPSLFHQMPSVLFQQTRLALVIVATSLAVGLPCSTFNGIFVGLQRYEVPAVIIGGSRMLSAVCLILVVIAGGSLTEMAVAVALINGLSYILQYVMYRVAAPRVRFSTELISRQTVRELFDYCFSLGIWSFATLLVTGLDITLVGLFDFPAVAYYAVAATVITFILGLQNAIFTGLVPAAAVLDARNSASELGRTLISSTRYGMFLLLATGVPLFFAAEPILSLWVGRTYAEHTALILKVLVVANIIRLSAVPYAMLLIGSGQQRLVTISPLMEGGVNLAVSVIAGLQYGALGVACGTLVGAVVGIACNFVYNMPRSTRIAATRSHYFRDGYLRPLASSLPLALIYPFHWLFGSWPLSALPCVTLTLVGVWVFGLLSSEKVRMLSWLGLASGARADANA